MSTLNRGKNAKLVPPPPWTLAIPETEYHGAAVRGDYMSSGMLREFRRCPAQYHGIVKGTAARADSGAFRIGRAVHKLLLEGETPFRGAFTVGGPLNERTGRTFGPDTKAFSEWLRDNGLDKAGTLTSAEADHVRRMRDAAKSHPEIGRLFSDGWAERSARMTMEGVPCQIRIDWLRADGMAVDVKTVEDITRFESDARRFGYLHQFAFYRDGALAAGGGELEMTAVVLEKKPPYRAGVWTFPFATLEPYSIQNRQSLTAYRRCRETGRWPTGYESPRSFPPAGIPPVWLN